MAKRLAVRWRRMFRGSTLVALEFLFRRADDNLVIRGWGISRIAAEIGDLSPQRTKEILRTLRESGVLEIIERGGGNHPNAYRLHV